MPLIAAQEGFVGAVYRFDDAVLCIRHGRKSFAEDFDRLMMETVSLYFGGAGQAVQRGAFYNANGVGIGVQTICLIVGDVGFILTWNILIQRAAKGDIDHLDTPTNAEDRLLHREGDFKC